MSDRVRVQEVYVDEKIKYILLDSKGTPIRIVVKYLKYLDHIGKSRNTIKSYCYHLKLYYQYLEEEDIDFKNVNLTVLSNFIGWLRNPHQSTKVKSFKNVNAKRSERTVNTILTCILGFYDYLSRLDFYRNEVLENTKGEMPSRFREFKPFLHHVTKGQSIKRNILRLKEPKRRVMVLTKVQIEKIFYACSNVRDQLLIRILYEGGLRIGEALAIWIEDVDIGAKTITVRKSKTSNGQYRKVYVSSETINMFQDYLIDHHSENFDSNYLFVSISGEKRGEPLSLEAVYSLVRRLRRKTGIDFTLHMFRHTFATELYENGMDVSYIQRLLGHAQVQTTIQTYMHPSDSILRESYENAIKRMEIEDGRT